MRCNVRLCFLVLAVTLLLTACLDQVPPPPPPPPLPPQIEAPPPPPPPPPPVSKPAPPPVAQVPEAVTFVLSGASDTYSSLASIIKARLAGPSFQFVLPVGADLSPGLKAHLTTVKGPVVAIGLDAARAMAPQAATRDVIFALTFNFREHRLLESGSIGISMLADPRQTLKLLRELSPRTGSLALAIGTGGQDYLSVIGREAKRLGITLVTREVASDKELLLFATQLNPSIQAFWLLPDNRIISRDVIQQILAVNIKNGRASVVYAPELLKYGGMLSAQYDPEAIADCLVDVLQRPHLERARLHGTLLQPERAQLSINGDLVRTLGLNVPENRKHLLQAAK